MREFMWAKKSDQRGYYTWLSLKQHLFDTYQIAGCLFEHWLCRAQKESLRQAMGLPETADDEDGKRLVQFLALVHDIGKCTPAFQVKRGYNNSSDLDQALIGQVERCGFGGLSELNLASPKESPHALAGQYLLRQFGVREDLASVVGAHHGFPTRDKHYYQSQVSYTSNYLQSDHEDSAIARKWKSAQQEILDWALKLCAYPSTESLPAVSQTGQVLLSGLLIMADWIASNEQYFPLLRLGDRRVPDPVESTSGQLERLHAAWSRWYSSENIDASYNGDAAALYTQRFGSEAQPFIPRAVQAVFADVIYSCEDPGLFILEAPMGVGKTEAALAGAEILAAKTGSDGLFFGLPTQATSNGIFPRILEWTRRLSQAYYGARLSIQLKHGKAALNEDFAQLTEQANLARQVNIDGGPQTGDAQESVTVNQWFAGRKTAALDDFVVGTVDQFLLLALKQKHLALRHLGFSKKVVIIDELHSCDSYMNVYLDRAIQWMGAYGVPMILLSATLPAQRRRDLCQAYLSGKGFKKPQEQEKKGPSAEDDKEKRMLLQSEDAFTTSQYPLITYTDGRKILQQKDFTPEKDRAFQVIHLKREELDEAIGRFWKSDGVIGLIVNTVKTAQDLARHFIERYGEEQVMLLHAHFIATERVKKENELLACIGKHASRPQHKLVIGTQVMEQSLDIDFDVLFTELAPMDLLLQRAGRLHRHKIPRSLAFQQPRLFVLGCDEQLNFDKGSRAVYGGCLLERTQYYLPDSIHMPGDISPLVQKVYPDDKDGKMEELALSGETAERYREMLADWRNQKAEQEKRASAYRLEGPKQKKTATLDGWLKNTHPDESEEYGLAQVRDSEETIEVIALKKRGEGYSLFSDSEDLSRRPLDYKKAKEIAANTLRLPAVFSKSHNITKTIKFLEDYTRKRFPDWERQSWLSGSLGIIFDENNRFPGEEEGPAEEADKLPFGNYVLHYDEKLGLSYDKRETEGV